MSGNLVTNAVENSSSEHESLLKVSALHFKRINMHTYNLILGLLLIKQIQRFFRQKTKAKGQETVAISQKKIPRLVYARKQSINKIRFISEPTAKIDCI